MSCSHAPANVGFEGGDACAEQAVSIAVSSLLGAVVPACPSGSAHPNACCTGGPAEKTACLEDPSAPFRACGSASFPFPDPARCCPLDGDGDCAPTPSRAAEDAGISCSSQCPPGSYPGDAVELCQGPGGKSCCTGDRAGMKCAEYSCPGGGGGAPCGECPSGWTLGNPLDLCCRPGPCGGECFSLLTSIPTFATPSGCSSDAGTCSCFMYDELGDIYGFSCEGSRCSCSLNGKGYRPLDIQGSCEIPAACGFAAPAP